MRTIRYALIGALLASLTLAACGSSGEDVEAGGAATSVTSTTVDPDTPVSLPGTIDDSGGDPAATTFTRIEPSDDLALPRVVEPTALVADPEDDSTVLVQFYGGVQECYGARATVVVQNAQKVKIKLETGSVAGGSDRACIEIAEAQELAVTLDAPLGDRTLEAVTAP